MSASSDLTTTIPCPLAVPMWKEHAALFARICRSPRGRPFVSHLTHPDCRPTASADERPDLGEAYGLVRMAYELLEGIGHE